MKRKQINQNILSKYFIFMLLDLTKALCRPIVDYTVYFLLFQAVNLNYQEILFKVITSYFPVYYLVPRNNNTGMSFFARNTSHTRTFETKQ